MAVETPVTNKAMVIDSGSTRIPALTCRPATGNQVNMFRSANRSAAGRPSMVTQTISVETNEPPAATVPTHPATGSPSRRPEDQVDDEAEQRQRDDGVGGVYHGSQPFNELMSSAVAPLRRR